MSTMCQNGTCTFEAWKLIGAENTQVTYAVCSLPNCAKWAKQTLQQDFPGRRITIADIDF